MAARSREEIQKIVEELLRQDEQTVDKALASKNSFMTFLEDAGLMYLIRKIGDGIEWILTAIWDWL